jgi:type I restriction enzyme, S subunit
MSQPWPTVSLGELIRLERRPVTVEPQNLYQEIGIYCFGRGIFHKTPRTGFEVGDKDLFLMKEGDFILQVTFAWEGAIAIVSAAEDGMYGSTRYPTFRVDESRCVPHFLLNYFKTEEGLQQLIKICPGSAGRNRVLSMRRIPEVLVPLPPLAEQRRVVARIEELAAQIHQARSLRHQAKEESEAFNASMIFGLLPQSSPVKPLGEVIAQESKLSYGVLVPGPNVDDGIPFVRIQDLALRNPPHLPAKRIAPEVDAQYRRTRLNGGEILIGVVGSIGKIGVAPRSWAGANIARAVCRIVPDKSVDRDYLAMVLSARSSQDFFRETTRTLAQPTLNVSQLSKTPIPVPPLPEQRRIVAELNALQTEVDALKRLQAEAAAELDALLPAILDKAFKGEM